MRGKDPRLEGRLIIVTGGAGGIGAQIARQIVGEGGEVIVTDVQEENGRALVKDLGAGARFFRHDVTSEAQWDELGSQCRARGGLHGLVNNAGIYDPRAIADTDAAFFTRNMQINQLGTFLGIRFAEQAAAETGASVVNISSLAGLRGVRGIAYTATKWAVRGMTKTAAVELAPRRIRVNSIHPAFIETPMLGAMSREYLEQRTKAIPLGRFGTVGDVADLVLFLLSDESAFITGAEVAIDGGLSA